MTKKKLDQDINVNAGRDADVDVIHAAGDYAGRDMKKNADQAKLVKWFVVGVVAIVLIVALAWGTKLFRFSAFGGAMQGENIESDI